LLRRGLRIPSSVSIAMSGHPVEDLGERLFRQGLGLGLADGCAGLVVRQAIMDVPASFISEYSPLEMGAGGEGRGFQNGK
jgi:hypothetical protein